jgi:hypothetical protein
MALAAASLAVSVGYRVSFISSPPISCLFVLFLEYTGSIAEWLPLFSKKVKLDLPRLKDACLPV